MKNLAIGFFLILGVSTGAFAQKIKLVSGDLSFLKGQKELNIEYDFSNLAVGKFKTEAEYKEKRIKELNAKEAGKGDTWSQSWENDKTGRFPSKFEELFSKGLSEFGYACSQNNENATYKLIVKTTFIEPGYNIGVSKMPASVNFEYIFVDASNPTKVLAKLTQESVPGAQFAGADFDTGTRISESYAKGGKMLAAFLAKYAK